MKKRNIIIISLSVVSLIFGGLVFLGVSTFPELLEEEKKEIEHPHDDVLLNTPSNDNKSANESTAVAVSSGASNYVVDSPKSFKSNSRLSSSHNYEVIHHFDDKVSLTIKEEPASNKEVVSNTQSSVNTPSTYYKGKSYVSLKREKAAKDLAIKEKLDRSEIIENRNKNIVNTIVLVVVAIEALAFIFLNRKRHLHKSQMPNR